MNSDSGEPSQEAELSQFESGLADLVRERPEGMDIFLALHRRLAIVQHLVKSIESIYTMRDHSTAKRLWMARAQGQIAAHACETLSNELRAAMIAGQQVHEIATKVLN